MSNVDKFRAAYTEALTYYVNKNPEEYLYSAEDIPRVVEKMIPSLAKGHALVGPAVKKAARALGIPQTYGGIKAYLNG